MNTTQTAVPIPDDVRDNSETVTDYAFNRHLSRVLSKPLPGDRDQDIAYADIYKYTHYQWSGTTQGDRHGYGAGQRYQVDLLVNRDGGIAHHYLTEYFTRVPCPAHDAYYAAYYASVTDQDGVSTIPAPYCDECIRHLRRSAREAGMTLNLSEPLRIGQHD